MTLNCPRCGPVTLSEMEIKRQLGRTVTDSFRCPRCNSVLRDKKNNRAVKYGFNVEKKGVI